jgi:hypothetical protein
MEPDRAQRDCRAACVISQQYSSATLILLRFNSRQETYSARFKTFIYLFIYFAFEKLRKSEIV